MLRRSKNFSWESTYARFNLPARSRSFSRFEVSRMPLPVALFGRRGAAVASLARMACVFLILLTPAFFFRCLWFGIVPLEIDFFVDASFNF